MNAPLLTNSQAVLGPKNVTLRKLGWGGDNPRVEITLNGYGLGHVPVRYAAFMFPEVSAWLND